MACKLLDHRSVEDRQDAAGPLELVLDALRRCPPWATPPVTRHRADPGPMGDLAAPARDTDIHVVLQPPRSTMPVLRPMRTLMRPSRAALFLVLTSAAGSAAQG